MSASDENIVGIDIGTTKVTTLIGEIGKNNTLRIKGYGISGSKGVKKGLVIDISEATRSILNSIEMAEKSSRAFIENAYIGITGKHISLTNNWRELNITSPGNIIRKADVDKLISMANKVDIPSQSEIVHTLIKQFVIDEEKGIIDPIGLSADKLAVELVAVYGTSSLIRNVVNSIKTAKIGIEDIIVEALASSEAVLTPEEKKSGVILLDIGGGTTDVAVYKDKKMIFTYCLPVGGDLITNDISIGLNIPFSKAEEIKKKFANVDYNFYDTLNRLNIGDVKIDSNKTTLNIRLYNIVNCRVKELLNLIKEKIEGYNFIHKVPCGLVITGGSSLLKGVAPLANSVFNLPARLGTSCDIEGPLEVVNNPIYSTGVGLLKYAYQLENYLNIDQIGEKNESNTFINKFREFILRILKNESR
ncbi:MAG: cell division protein FtsA [Actinomycetota bacterium]|nr:cell division protein FtsA [Actinomycetota bacterium]